MHRNAIRRPLNPGRFDCCKRRIIQTKTAQLLRCKFDVVNRTLHRSVERGERRRALEGISPLSVDEKAIHRGHKYATVVSDSDRGVVLDVGQGRDKNSVKALLRGLLGI